MFLRYAVRPVTISPAEAMCIPTPLSRALRELHSDRGHITLSGEASLIRETLL